MVPRQAPHHKTEQVGRVHDRGTHARVIARHESAHVPDEPRSHVVASAAPAEAQPEQ